MWTLILDVCINCTIMQRGTIIWQKKNNKNSLQFHKDCLWFVVVIVFVVGSVAQVSGYPRDILTFSFGLRFA